MSDLGLLAESTGNHLPARRRWLVAAVATAAGLGGIGLALRMQRTPSTPEKVEAGLWRMTFAMPDGGSLDMASLRGRPVLLNFWASWCQPCVEELPLLNGFFRENSTRGWQVIGLAVDQLDPVKRFLAKAPVSFPIALAGSSGIELGKSLGNLSGGLPFTVVFGSEGLVAHRKMGKVTPEDLRAWSSLS